MSGFEASARDALRAIPYPGFSRDIVSLQLVRSVAESGQAVTVVLDLSSSATESAEIVKQAVRQALAPLAAGRQLRIQDLSGGAPSLSVQGGGSGKPRRSAAASGGVDAKLVPGIKQIVAVASGKGGVGKSTVSVNLAVALAQRGLRVGLLDADIYGPSIPLMTGIDEAPKMTPERKLIPFERYGIRVMSLGFLVEEGSAVIWRGPMVMKALEQLLRDVVWGELDLLLVDMPPGTGDAQLTMSQRVNLAGAVIVTTPQDVALADARKGIAMFNKVGVPLLGLIENMSHFICPHCDERSEIFGHGGGRREAERLDVPFLGEVPLHVAFREAGDQGRPVSAVEPEGPNGQAIDRIAESVAAQLEPAGPPPERAEGVVGRFRDLFKRPSS